MVSRWITYVTACSDRVYRGPPYSLTHTRVETGQQRTVKMKLSVAIAVLMLVFAAHTEAQEEEQTIEQRFASFQNQMKDLTDGLVEKTKATFDQIHQSGFATDTRNWFTEQFEKVKQKVEETFPGKTE